MELQLFFPSSFSNSYCSTTDEENGSFEDENAEEHLINADNSDSPRPSTISLFMTYRQFRNIMDLMDSSERLTPIVEEPELEPCIQSIDAVRSFTVPHPSVRSLEHSANTFYTGVAQKKKHCASVLTLRTLSGSSSIAKSSSGTCCFVWLRTILKWKSRRTKNEYKFD